MTCYDRRVPGEAPRTEREEGFDLSSLEGVLRQLLKMGFFVAAPDARRGHVPLTEHNVHQVVNGQPHKLGSLALVGVPRSEDADKPKGDAAPGGPLGGPEGLGAH